MTVAASARPVPLHHIVTWPAAVVTLAAVLFSLQADAFDYPVLLTLGGIALVLSILAVLTSASRRSLLTMGFAGGALALSALVVVIGIDAALTYSYVADVPGY